MPPPKSNLSLEGHEIALIKRWIEQGAEWKPHWAFVAPEKQETPKIKGEHAAQNSIDHFVIKKQGENSVSEVNL